MGTSGKRTENVHRDLRQPRRAVIYYINAVLCWLWRIKPCAPLFLFLIGCNPPLTPTPAGLVLAPIYHLSYQSCDREFKAVIFHEELPADDCEMLEHGHFDCTDCHVSYEPFKEDLY